MGDVVVVTGSLGGIGSSITSILRSSGYRVVGIDITCANSGCEDDIAYDLTQLSSTSAVERLASVVRERIGSDRLVGLVNNAAKQIVVNFETLSVEQFSESMHINCTAAFAMSKALYSMLKMTGGTIINMGSIHSRLTKPNFIAYACSKAAIEGLTRAMAVELGGIIRICGISPAAVDTNMLREGFNGDKQSLEILKNCHPTHAIGTPNEITTLVLLLLSKDIPFINGAILNIDGGISSVLHDP